MDRSLISQALAIHSSEFLSIDALIAKAADEETKNKLRRIQITKNHIDEAMNHNL